MATIDIKAQEKQELKDKWNLELLKALKKMLSIRQRNGIPDFRPCKFSGIRVRGGH